MISPFGVFLPQGLGKSLPIRMIPPRGPRKVLCVVEVTIWAYFTGKVAEKALVSADITVNKNMVPFDSRSAFQTSGIRLGTPAITTRGAKEDLMLEIAEMIETVLSNVENEAVIAEVRARVNKTMEKYPLFAY